MFSLLKKLATRNGIIVLFLATHSVLAVMMFYTFPVINEQIGTQAFDLKTFGYSQEEAVGIVSSLDQDTKELYLFPQLFLLDVLYPLLLALMLGAMMIRLMRSLIEDERAIWYRLYLLPFAAMIFDYVENILIVIMISSNEMINPKLVQVSSMFTQLKSMVTIICWVIIIVLFVLWLVKKYSIGLRK